MDNHRSSKNGIFSQQFDQQVLLGSFSHTLGVGGDVTQVTNVSGVVLRSTVSLLEGVEVRTSRGAPVGVVTKLVDVETSQGIGVVTGDFPRDLGGFRFLILFKVDYT